MIAWREYYQNWKHRRYLKKMGWTQKQYEYHTDPDRNIRASRVQDYFQGYTHVHCFENRKHQIYYWDLGYDGSREIMEWCEDNCKDKFRFDCLRVINCPATAWQWEINEIGGGDYYFTAFKNQEDAIMFTLRWS
jgi:hypothetical protein